MAKKKKKKKRTNRKPSAELAAAFMRGCGLAIALMSRGVPNVAMKSQKKKGRA